jgi:hypothetical protein
MLKLSNSWYIKSFISDCCTYCQPYLAGFLLRNVIINNMCVEFIEGILF